MAQDFVLLTEKEEMWTEMLMEVLRDNQIPCASMGVNGAGFSIKTGKPDWLKVYVPQDFLPQAEELLNALFSDDAILEDEV